MSLDIFHFNLVWLGKFDCQKYQSNWKLTIVNHEMTDWQRSDGKMTSGSNFKLNFCYRFWDTDRSLPFQFRVIWEVWLSEVLNWLKIGHYKTRNSRLAGNDGKMASQSYFWVFTINLVFNFSLVLFEKFHNWCTQLIVNFLHEQKEMTDSQGNDGKWHHTTTWS